MLAFLGLASGFAYDWELRRGAEVVGTGRLYEEAPIRAGDFVTLGGRELLVREVLPAPQPVDGRLILVLPD